MAVLGVQRLLSAQLVLNFPTVAAALIAHFEIGIVLMDFVWCSEFPLIELSICAAPVAIVTVFCVSRSDGHVLAGCV